MSRSKISLIVVVIIILILAILIWPKKIKPDQNYLSFGETNIKIELADTPAKQELGLSGRESLAQDTGMLFIFDKPGRYGFWMKEMRFAIDIIWLDSEWRIVGIHYNINPSTYPTVFYPTEPAQYVLEVNARWTSQNNIATGTSAIYIPGKEVPTI
ncbi:MAG: DUF192 domain-containing protein [Candidatus Vogelbacteria bacterium]|nr:DUF192 domain-containing protein [Candidatus Vogelbacteria bacterium]